MCLSIPAIITEIDGMRGKVDVQGNVTETDLRLIDEPKVGDYVLVHAGFAIEKLPPEEALKTLSILKELIVDDTEG